MLHDFHELAPIVKSAFWQSAVNAHDFLFYIHAGVVGLGNTCLLMPAAAGSGKSSLTAALVHGGFLYYSDEVALIQRADFRVPPVPLAICVKSTGWDLMTKYFPALAELPTHLRGDGKLVRYIAPAIRRCTATRGPSEPYYFSALWKRHADQTDSDHADRCTRPSYGGMPCTQPEVGPAKCWRTGAVDFGYRLLRTRVFDTRRSRPSRDECHKDAWLMSQTFTPEHFFRITKQFQ